MKKEIYSMSLSTDNGKIYISQSSFGNEDDEVCIYPEEVDILISWLQEAKSELINKD